MKKVRLCPHCNCVTKDIPAMIDISIRCGKCGKDKDFIELVEKK